MMDKKLFTIKSGRVIISDPSRPSTAVLNAVPGVWEARVIYQAVRGSQKGRTNAGLEVYLQGIDKYPERLEIEKKVIISESGQIGVFDQPAYHQPNTPGHKVFLEKCSDILEESKGWDVLDNSGVLAWAGAGCEGNYIITLFTDTEDGSLVRISVDFLDSYEDDFVIEEIQF